MFLIDANEQNGRRHFLLVVVSGYLRKETEWKHTNFSRLHLKSALPPDK